MALPVTFMPHELLNWRPLRDQSFKYCHCLESHPWPTLSPQSVSKAEATSWLSDEDCPARQCWTPPTGEGQPQGSSGTSQEEVPGFGWGKCACVGVANPDPHKWVNKKPSLQGQVEVRWQDGRKPQGGVWWQWSMAGRVRGGGDTSAESPPYTWIRGLSSYGPSLTYAPDATSPI